MYKACHLLVLLELCTSEIDHCQQRESKKIQATLDLDLDRYGGLQDRCSMPDHSLQFETATVLQGPPLRAIQRASYLYMHKHMQCQTYCLPPINVGT